MSKSRVILENSLDSIMHCRARAHEVNKFKDPRRVGIFSRVVLTKEQEEAIDDLYLRNYGERIPYTWHRHYTAFSGKFDVNYFPELLYIPEFERYMNLWPQYARAFADKNVLPILAEHAGIKTPKCILSSTRGLLKEGYGRSISREDAVKLLDNFAGGVNHYSVSLQSEG